MEFTPEQQAAINVAAKAFCDAKLKFLKEYRASLLTGEEFPAKWRAYEESVQIDTTEKAASYLPPFTTAALKCVVQGGFHPSNTITRKLFHAITGVKLPPSCAATLTAVDAYFGEALTAYRTELRIQQEAKNAERAKVAQEKREREAAANAARLEAVTERCKAGEMVTGDELVDLCRHLGVFVHPRSVRLWRDKITQVGDGTGRKYGKKTSMDSAFAAYDACREKLPTTPLEVPDGTV